MVRALFGTLAVAAFFVTGSAFADEFKARILKIDPDKKAVTFVNGDGKEKTLTITSECKLPATRMGRTTARNGKNGEAKAMTLTDLAKRVEFAHEKGLPVFLTLEPKGGKDAVTEIRIDRNEKPTALDRSKVEKK